MPVMNNLGIGYDNYGNAQYGLQQFRQQPTQISQIKFDYVKGIEGANAYAMPPGVTEAILWDIDFDQFYIKKLDQLGRPRVVAWKDFTDHIEPERKDNTIGSEVDMSQYLTREELANTLNKLGLSQVLTKSDLDKALEGLTVGVGGKVVRSSELSS